jgi:hypothetical protein
MTLKTTIEEAINDKAPDALSIQVEGETSEPKTEEPHHGGFALPVLAR